MSQTLEVIPAAAAFDLDTADERGGLPSMSSAERWINCPGSVAMCRGLDSKTGPYAADGNVVHSLMAGEIDPEEGEVRDDLVQTASMAETILARHAELLGFVGDDVEIISEERIWLHDGAGNAVASGKSDRIYLHRRQKRALIGDAKSGRKAVNPAPANPQMIGYALLAQEEYGVTEVFLAIAQPWRPWSQQPIGSIDADTLDYQRGVYLAAIAAATAIQTPEEAISGNHLSAGPWCDYCPARAMCPASIEIQNRFLQVTQGATAPTVTDLPGRYALWTPEQKLQMWDFADHVAKTVKDFKAMVKDELTADPMAIPGLQLSKGKERATLSGSQAVLGILDAHGLGTERALSCASLSLNSLASVAAGGKPGVKSLPKAAKEKKDALKAALGDLLKITLTVGSVERV